MQDSGLFVAMLEQGTTASLLNGDLGMYKGATNENTKSSNTVLNYMVFLFE